MSQILVIKLQWNIFLWLIFSFFMELKCKFNYSIYFLSYFIIGLFYYNITQCVICIFTLNARVNNMLISNIIFFFFSHMVRVYCTLYYGLQIKFKTTLCGTLIMTDNLWKNSRNFRERIGGGRVAKWVPRSVR